MCSDPWRNRFSRILVTHMVVGGSDHLPIWIEFNKRRKNFGDTRDRWCCRIHFKDYWSSYDDYKGLIELSWDNACNLKGSDCSRKIEGS